MPKKPAKTRNREQRRVPNEMHTAAGGALLAANAVLAAAAVDLEVQDAAEGNPLRGRYVRIRNKLMELKGCSGSAAQRAIAEGKVIFLERWRADMPQKREKIAMQLQAIADEHQHEMPGAAIAALREIGKLHGLYAPTKVSVMHGNDLSFQLDDIIGILDDAGRAALEVLMSQIDRAKNDGRLALPEPAMPLSDEEEIEDAVIVEPDGSN